MPRSVVALIIVVSLSAAACGGGDDSPAAPTPVVPACQANNTGNVKFENRSASGTVYTVIWDGSNTVTLSPGQVSDPRTVAAGVAHSLEFRIANSYYSACARSNPIIPQCDTVTYWCTY